MLKVTFTIEQKAEEGAASEEKPAAAVCDEAKVNEIMKLFVKSKGSKKNAAKKDFKSFLKDKKKVGGDGKAGAGQEGAVYVQKGKKQTQEEEKAGNDEFVLVDRQR